MIAYSAITVESNDMSYNVSNSMIYHHLYNDVVDQSVIRRRSRLKMSGQDVIIHIHMIMISKRITLYDLESSLTTRAFGNRSPSDTYIASLAIAYSTMTDRQSSPFIDHSMVESRIDLQYQQRHRIAMDLMMNLIDLVYQLH
jgi:hypothetical protein